MPAEPSRLKAFLRVLANPAWVCFTWFGATAAVALVATPARFDAVTATRRIALDVGREVFLAMNRAELMLLVVFLVLVRTSGLARRLWPWVGGLVLILVAQSAWLLPELAARTDMVVAGTEPPPSNVHALYAAFELAKWALLVSGGAVALAAGRSGPAGGSAG